MAAPTFSSNTPSQDPPSGGKCDSARPVVKPRRWGAYNIHHPRVVSSEPCYMKPVQGKAYDGIPAGVIDIVWHSSLQGRDSRGWEPSSQMEGGWNPTFAILVSSSAACMTRRTMLICKQLKTKEQATLLPHATKYFIVCPSQALCTTPHSVHCSLPRVWVVSSPLSSSVSPPTQVLTQGLFGLASEWRTSRI